MHEMLQEIIAEIDVFDFLSNSPDLTEYQGFSICE